MNRQEQLCAHIMRTRTDLTPSEIARPWTWLHRQWINGDGDRCAECVGVLIQRDDDSVLRVNYADAFEAMSA